MSSAIVPRLKSVLTPVVKELLLRSGGPTLLRRLAPSSHLAILRYHAVVDPANCWYASPDICVSSDAFAAHVEYLARHYRVLRLDDAVATLAAGRRLPAGAVAITFDDGYADNLEAARTLHRHGLTATFYMTAGCIADQQPFWPSEVRYLLARLNGRQVRLTHDEGVLELAVPPGGDWSRLARGVNALFKSVTIAQRERLRHELRTAVAAPPMPAVMLTWDEVREMHALGMTIGCHTLTHANLPSAGIADATHEILVARDRLREEVGAPVTMFSYPNGGALRYFSDELKKVVRDGGFTAATTSRNGFATSASDMFALERVHTTGPLREVTFALEVERFWRKPLNTHEVDG